MNNKRFIFTNKTNPPQSIMSTVLGVISLGAVIFTIFMSYENGGEASARYGATCLLSLIFAVVGIFLGVYGKMQKERFYLFSYIGIVLNIATVLLLSGILYAGALMGF